MVVFALISLAASPVQGPADTAQYVSGSCPIPPNTNGRFFPLPVDEDVYLLKVGADRQWIMVGDDDAGSRLIKITSQTRFSGSKPTDYLHLEYVENARSEFIALSIQKLQTPATTLDGNISEVGPERASPGTGARDFVVSRCLPLETGIYFVPGRVHFYSGARLCCRRHRDRMHVPVGRPVLAGRSSTASGVLRGCAVRAGPVDDGRPDRCCVSGLEGDGGAPARAPSTGCLSFRSCWGAMANHLYIACLCPLTR